MVDPLFIPIFGVIFGVPAIAWATTDIVRRVLKHKEVVHSGHAVENAAFYAAKVERLEQRMGVMERILTDRSTHLSEEIERLRDAPIN